MGVHSVNLLVRHVFLKLVETQSVETGFLRGLRYANTVNTRV